jgi:hypothetical protein
MRMENLINGVLDYSRIGKDINEVTNGLENNVTRNY